MTVVDDTTPGEGLRLRRIRSFVRREGRMTDGQERALEQQWPRYGIAAPAQPIDLAALFGREAPRMFEIGFGNGEHLLARAAAEPGWDFIGVEVHRPGVGGVLNRAAAAGLSNLRVASHDAVEVLRDGLPDASLDQVVIQFPDPWHKKRHHKRRLVQPEFAALLAQKIKPGGELQLATDWAPYAEHMLEVLNVAPGFRNLSAEG
ncbi:MAG TPA: tRNA (guanosine(46)-N7)-methyltransferase TrmB, partial [Solimonas sp.]|nr:tRNA (guanosine(46)-N7)-methyltransferase TrmB [Solimonas sp.]